MNPKWRQMNNISSFTGKEIVVKQQTLPDMPAELFDLFDPHELEKYMTPEEMTKGGAK
jgi:succinate dehydrogenase / fumarate reductase flavoprotein subunit